jgi:nucleoside-diphosphate-sugar epimerase
MSNLTQCSFLEDDCRKSCQDPLSLKSLINQSILITGGTGFMGKWLTEMVLYLNKEHKFNIKLYLLAREIEKFKLEVPHIAKNSYIFYIEQDVKNISELPTDINFVIHAAGSPDSRLHASEPLRIIDTFLKGTTAVFDACIRLPNLQKIIHVSSNYVYGNVDKKEGGIKEVDLGLKDCNSIHAAYGEVKRITETLCAIYRNQQQLPVTVIRPFAFIGPYQKLDKPWAINNFIREALLGGPIRIIGNENAVRSYLYGSDMAFWILTILSNGLIGEVINIGSDERVSLIELARLITDLCNSKIKTISRSSNDSNDKIPSLVPDISNAEKLNLGITYNLNESIKRTLEWNKLI